MSVAVVGSVAFDSITFAIRPAWKIFSVELRLLLAGRKLLHRRAGRGRWWVRLHFGARECLRKRGIDTRGIERAKGRPSAGRAISGQPERGKDGFHRVECFQSFQPRIPKEYEDNRQFLFLATSTDRRMQLSVRRKLPAHA